MDTVTQSTNPLGEYAEGVAAFVTIAAVVAALVMHLAEAVVALQGGLASRLDLTWIDLLATTVVGYVFGARASSNGASRQAMAAHARLDAIHAPSSATVVEGHDG